MTGDFDISFMILYVNVHLTHYNIHTACILSKPLMNIIGSYTYIV